MPRNLADRRHRVGGELAAAGARAGAGLSARARRGRSSVMRARGVRADRFEHVLNRDVACRANGPARSSRRRAPGPGCRAAPAPSPRPGIVLSQPTRTTSASKRLPRATSSIESAMTSRLTSEARMPSRAHRDAVGDRDGVELDRRAAGLANALLHVRGQLAQVVVAGADLDPGVGDADERPARSSSVRPVALAAWPAPGARLGPVGQRGAAPFERVGRTRQPNPPGKRGRSTFPELSRKVGVPFLTKKAVPGG